MDFITDLPPSKKNSQIYDMILVVIDRFTKLVWYILTRKTINISELVDLFIQYIFKDFGSPKSITNNRGFVFTSKF
jgi:hypothetical protein